MEHHCRMSSNAYKNFPLVFLINDVFSAPMDACRVDFRILGKRLEKPASDTRTLSKKMTSLRNITSLKELFRKMIGRLS